MPALPYAAKALRILEHELAVPRADVVLTPVHGVLSDPVVTYSAWSAEDPSTKVGLALDPHGRIPPLVVGQQPVWDFLFVGSALLRLEGLSPSEANLERACRVLHFALAGPGGRLATAAYAESTLRDARSRHCLGAVPQALTIVERPRGRWLLRWPWVLPDGSVEGWQAVGVGDSLANAEGVIWYPEGSWPHR
jgi:hypothetical protein